MTRSTKLLVPALLAVLAVAAFWFLAMAPKRDEAARLENEVAAKRAEADQARAQAVTYAQAKRRYRVNYSKLTRLGKAVPADDDVRSLLIQLDDAADRADVDFHTISVGAEGAKTADDEPGSGSGELAPAPGTVPVGTAGFLAMPFAFGFEGSFFHLSNFFSRLERFVTVSNRDIDVTGRLLLLGSFSVTPKDGNLNALSAQIGAASYLVPPVEPVGTATSQAPSTAAGQQQGAAPGTETTPATPSTPTATITGVR